MDRKPAYFAIIPAVVRYDNELPANAKLLYGEISALTGPEGFCWASNGYFSSLFGMSKDRIRHMFALLEQRGHIAIEVIREAQTNQVMQRRIWPKWSLVDAEIQRWDVKGNEKEPPLAKNSQTSGQNQPNPPAKNSRVYNRKNNTSKNNTPIVPKEIEEKLVDYAGSNGELLSALLGLAEARMRARRPLSTVRAVTLLLNKLDKYSGGDDAAKISLLDAATERGWLTVYPPKDGGSESSPAPQRVQDDEAVAEW